MFWIFFQSAGSQLCFNFFFYYLHVSCLGKHFIVAIFSDTLIKSFEASCENMIICIEMTLDFHNIFNWFFNAMPGKSEIPRHGSFLSFLSGTHMVFFMVVVVCFGLFFFCFVWGSLLLTSFFFIVFWQQIKILTWFFFRVCQQICMTYCGWV